MDRREFLKATGLTGSALLVGACESHHSILQAYGDRPPELIPGEATYFATACDLCAAGCGAMVRVVEGRVVKLEGLPFHPVNQGGLCPLGQSAVQHQYHPDRFVAADVRPTRGTASEAYLQLISLTKEAYGALRGDPSVLQFGPDRALHKKKWGEMRGLAAKLWDEALGRLVTGLESAGSQSLILVGNQVRGHRYGLFARFAELLRAPAPVVVEPLGYEAVRMAHAGVYGRGEIPHYDIENSELAVVFGEELFTQGLAPPHYTWAYSRLRQGRERLRGQLVVVSTRFGESAALADLWIPVRPGTHGAIAQALVADVTRGGIAPALAAKFSGAPEEKVHKLLELWQGAKPAIAVGGGEILGHTNAVATLRAIAYANVTRGSVGIVGGVLPAPPPPIAQMAPPTPASYRDLSGWVEKMRSGQLKALLLVGLDPYLGFPASARLDSALRAVSLIATFASLPDDGTRMADLILPDNTFLERWGDSTPGVGVGDAVATLMQPAVNPFFETRSAEDVILAAAKAMGRELGFANGAAYFKQMWAVAAPDKVNPGSQSPWIQALRAGGTVSKSAAAAYSPRSVVLPVPQAPEFDGDPRMRPFILYPVGSLKYRNGLASHLPWMQEIADPMSAAAWGGWAELNPLTCDRLGLALYDEIEIASDHGSITLGVVPFPGIPEDVVGVPIGYSKKEGSRYDREAAGQVWAATRKEDPGRGADARALLANVIEPGAGSLAWGATRVAVTKTGKKIALGRLVMVSKQVAPQESPILPHKMHQEFKVWPIG